MPRKVPQRLVDHRKKLARIAAPAPGKIGSDGSEPFDALGEVRDFFSVDGHSSNLTGLGGGAKPSR